MVKCVVFDFDGTLVMSNSIKKEAFHKVAAKLGNYDNVLDDVLVKCEKGDRYDVFREFVYEVLTIDSRLHHRDTDKIIFDLIQDYTRTCEMLIGEASETTGAEECLKALYDKGYILFINSATPENTLVEIAEKRNIKDYFSGIYGRPKSKIDNMNIILRNKLFIPEEIVLVGDGEVDKMTALEIGCHFIGIINGESHFLELPRYKVESLQKIPQIIKDIDRSSGKGCRQ